MITTPFVLANPEALSLGAGEAHIWRLDLDERLFADSALDAAERQRFSRLVDREKRARRLKCRHMLRTILGAYLNQPAAQLRFRHGPHGRPHLDQATHATDLNFNLSHAGSLAVIALARAPRLGVDIEIQRPLARMDRLLGRCFSAAEAQFITSRPDRERARLFFRAWTAKEALLKADGAGIFHQPATVELACEPALRLSRLDGDPAKAAAWRLWEFVPAAGAFGTLALPAGDWKIHCLATSPGHP